MLTTVLFTLFLLPILNASPVIKQVINECTPAIDPIGQLCVNVTRKDCFELTGVVTLRDNTVLSRTVSISQAIDMIARRKTSSQPVLVCESLANLNIPTPVPCSICVYVDKLQIQEDDLNFCGRIQVNCSLGVKREIVVPCLNITDCAIFGCKNGCGTGTCSPIGVCVCPPGYFGPDCSTTLKDNCVQSSSTSTSCWSFSFPTCDTMAVTTSTSQQDTLLNVNQSSLTLVPCQAVTKSPCQLCVDAENVHPEGNRLIGCPVLKDKCSGIEIRHESDCTVLATSDSLLCSTSSGSSDLEDETTPKTYVLVAMIVVLVLSILGFGGYYAFRRYQSSQQASFRRVPNGTDEMEVVPLGQATDDDGEN